MKQRTVYCCEFCEEGQFSRADACEAHEATHFGLSTKEYQTWKALCRGAAAAGKSLGCCSTPENRAVFDRMIQELCEFEAAHKLIGSSKPTDFYY